MRRQTEDRLLWILLSILLVVVVGTAIYDSIIPYESNRQQTAALSTVGIKGYTDHGLIDINSADADLLMTVKGIGPVLSQRIIQYREEFGDFESVDELIEVKGIGPKTLEKMRRYIGVQ